MSPFVCVVEHQMTPADVQAAMRLPQDTASGDDIQRGRAATFIPDAHTVSSTVT